MAPRAKHPVGFKQTAVELADGSFGQQNTSVPPGSMVGGAVSVTGVATQVVGEIPVRITRLVAQAGNTTVFLGDASVTVSTGYPLAAGAGMEIVTTATIHAIAATGTISVRFLNLTKSD